MCLKHWILIVAGFTGILLVVLFPRWFYPAHSLIPRARTIGHRFIGSPPQPKPVEVEDEGGRKHIYLGIRIDARIDYSDLSSRVGMIIAAVSSGLLVLRPKNGRNRRDIEQKARGKSVEATNNSGVDATNESRIEHAI